MVTWEKLVITAICFIGIYALMQREAIKLNLLALDEHSAQALGVDVKKTRRIAFFCSTLLVAVAVSFAGIIGFIGLIVPHIARSLFGSDMAENMFFSSIFGALLLMVADTLARIIIPGGAELPVGVLTALGGGTFFFYLLKTRREKFWND